MPVASIACEPLVEELLPAPDPEEAFLCLCGLPHCVFLDSALGATAGLPSSAGDTIAQAGCHGHACVAMPHPRQRESHAHDERGHGTRTDRADMDGALGRYSFLAADPPVFLRFGVDEPDALGRLAAAMEPWSARAIEGLPPFQGGAAGLFSYDLGRQLEGLPRPRADEFGVPALAVGLYDVVIAWDHLSRRAWIVSRGLPECLLPSSPARGERPGGRGPRMTATRTDLAARRLAFFRRRLAVRRARSVGLGATAGLPSSEESTVGRANRGTPRATAGLPSSAAHQPGEPLPLASLSRQHPIAEHAGLFSDFSRSDYLRAVERVIAYIEAGDVFQVNLAQRLLCPAGSDSVSLYRRLRRCNAAPFAAYFDLGDFQVVSASPERFLRVRAGQVETRPIKGTRPRSPDLDKDEAVRGELLASAKDRAENVMIVDLMRNDLGRVCRPGSVRVGDVCRLETYPFVHHLVSSVTGRLHEDRGPIDLLRAAFPGGSITGAPKIRAMQIIAELEPVARGPYCGSLGYLGLDGSMDLSILIRTITAGRGWWQAPVGGGIVAESDPAREYDETWHKAEGLLRAMRGP